MSNIIFYKLIQHNKKNQILVNRFEYLYCFIGVFKLRTGMNICAVCISSNIIFKYNPRTSVLKYIFNIFV